MMVLVELSSALLVTELTAHSTPLLHGSNSIGSLQGLLNLLHVSIMFDLLCWLLIANYF